MARQVLWLAVLMLLPAASASLVEQASGAAYQDDAFRPGDASDRCDRARPISFPYGFDGLLVAEDDVFDFYMVDIPAARVGTVIDMELEAWSSLHQDDAPIELRPDVDLYVYEPGCATYLASARSYNGSEELAFIPAHSGKHVVLVLLYAPVADLPVRTGVPAPVPELGYTLTLR